MNFIKGSLFTIISKAIMFFSALFVSIYIARILGPEAKGMYYLLVQMVSIVVLFGLFGITNSSVYFLGRQRMPRSELYGDLVFLTVLSSAIFFLLIMALQSVLLKSILKGVPAQHVRIMTFVIPLLMLNQIFLSIVLGMNRIVLFNVLEMSCYFLLFLNFLLFTVFFGMGIYGAYLSFIVTHLLMVCIYILLFIKKIKLHIRFEEIWDILHYALRSFLGPICFLLICKVDSFVLNFFSDIRQVGFYSIAISFAELLSFIPLAIGTVLFPKLASQEIELLNTSTVRVVRVIFSFLILLTLIFLLVGRWLIIFIYGNMYNSSVMPMYILLPGFVFISLYYLFSSYFNAIGKPEVVTVILVITLFIKFLSSIFAVVRWGMFGAASTSTVSYFISGLFFLVVFQRASKKSLRDIFIIRSADIKYVWDIFANSWKTNKVQLP